jgi:hypothetical protein
MERAHGESLVPGWLSLSTEEAKHIMTQTAEIEQRKKIFFSSFPGYGGLHHKRDVEDECQLALHVRDFYIGSDMMSMMSAAI